jgi:mannosyltransferase
VRTAPTVGLAGSATATGTWEGMRGRAGRLAAARVPELLGIALLMAWAVHARTRDLGAPLWIDEGISMGIARHPLTAIGPLLRQDGSPPLFYVLLHWWTGLFGATVRSGHALALLFAVLAIPAAAWAAWRPFGPRAGVAAAAIVALDPFAAGYADELRMYSLLLLCGLLATGAFLRAFVVAPGHRGWSATFAVALAAVLYAHNWGLFFGAAAGLAWLMLVAVAGPRRRALLTGGLVAFGGAALLFAPWVPTVLDQAAHTGAPWSHAPGPASIGHASKRMLGGQPAETVLLLFAAAGLGGLLRRRSSPQARAVAACVVLAAGTFAVAYAWSDLSSPAWALRYLSIVLAPAAVVIGAGLARTGPVAVLVLAVLFLTSWYDNPTHDSLAHKSNVSVVAARLGGRLRTGDVVFSTQPESVPVLRFYLPGGLRYATPLGAVPDPGVVDWRDALTRLDRPKADAVLRGLLAGLRPGRRLLLVQPHFVNPGAPWTRRIRILAHEAIRDVHADPSLRIAHKVIPHRGYNRSEVSGLLVERRAAARAPHT